MKTLNVSVISGGLELIAVSLLSLLHMFSVMCEGLYLPSQPFLCTSSSVYQCCTSINVNFHLRLSVRRAVAFLNLQPPVDDNVGTCGGNFASYYSWG